MSQQSPITNHQSPRPPDRRKVGADIRTALSEAIAQLSSEQVPSAALAAELLLMHTLGQDRVWIYSHPEFQLAATERERFFKLIARRASGVPTQHLTGHQEFWGLDFEVTPDVLIPRPETEHVIEVAMERLGVGAGASSRRGHESFHIADVGTGSGCVAIALASELPAAQIVATDNSGAALKVAHRNATSHRVASRIEFIKSDLMKFALQGSWAAGHESRPFDLIVSNPPYIASRDAVTLPREVREHEPAAALFGGEAGTEFYAPLIAQAAALLKPGGNLVLELGHNCAEHVSGLLNASHWTTLSITNDLAGIRRVASARRNSD